MYGAFVSPVRAFSSQNVPILGTEGFAPYAISNFSTSTLIYDIWGTDAPHMFRIATCESGQRQFYNNGKTVESPTDDWGFFQINAHTWDKKAKELGLDYKGSLIDNIKMAKVVWNAQGFDAWTCNKSI